jgi:hypothetical protein
MVGKGRSISGRFGEGCVCWNGPNRRVGSGSVRESRHGQLAVAGASHTVESTLGFLGIEGWLYLCALESLHLRAQHQDFIFGIVILVARTTRYFGVLDRVGSS